ncbi:hypothetical protein [Actinomadura macrotermitis]|uniref:SH3 domain-containing protein n=1 Tax=Actinomadura macrotermitis TaxID=2585200 RepID=A0A7K0BSZ8_9ACTN|nr:hypothetical protein [Actinomadura macrotermitis]MQY04299.1 hypothetical protein [Actinomadura macrotermitis]
MFKTSTLMKAALMAGGLFSPVVLTSGVAQAAAPAQAAATCYARALYGNTPIYQSTSTSSTKVGNMVQGQLTSSSCSQTVGGFYTACGSYSNYWVRLTYVGWVKAACVSIEL